MIPEWSQESWLPASWLNSFVPFAQQAECLGSSLLCPIVLGPYLTQEVRICVFQSSHHSSTSLRLHWTINLTRITIFPLSCHCQSILWKFIDQNHVFGTTQSLWNSLVMAFSSEPVGNSHWLGQLHLQRF